MADKAKRLKKIRPAKAALEAEARAAATDRDASPGRGRGEAPRRTAQEERPDPGAAQPGPRRQDERNFTDPDSRILLTKDGYIQGYNAQAAVEAHDLSPGRGFRQFLLRGVDKLKAEWALVCTAHNLTKLASPA